MKKILFFLLLISSAALAQNKVTVTLPGTEGGGGGIISTVNNDFRLSNDSLYLYRWANIMDYGAIPDGSTNNVTAINNAIVSGAKVIYIPPTVLPFIVTGTAGATPLLQLLDYQVLIGSGYYSNIKTTSGARIFALAVGNEVTGIRFTGDNSRTTTEEFQTALYLSSNDTLNFIHHNWFENFGGNTSQNGGGIVVKGTISGASVGNKIADNHFMNNHYAITLDARGEYVEVLNNKIVGSRVGIYNNAGNNTFTTNNIIYCDTAFKLDGGTNNGHSASSGNKYNHNLYNLIIESVTNGYTFDSDMLYAGNVWIRNSTGIRFDNCDFSTGTVTLLSNTSLYRSGRWLSMTKTLTSGEDFNVLGEQKTGTTAGYWVNQANADTVDIKGPFYGTIPFGVGTKAVRYNPSTRQYTYADTITGVSGATTALDNLASVAINTSLISDADNTDDLGSTSITWKDTYTRTVKLRSASAGTATLQYLGSGTPAIGLPDNTGTLVARSISGEASSATPTPFGNGAMNFYELTALATNAVFAAPSGTPVSHGLLWIIIKDDGTPRTLGWNPIYDEGTDLPLPTATIAGEGMELQFRWHGGDSKWRFVGMTGGFMIIGEAGQIIQMISDHVAGRIINIMEKYKRAI